MRSRDSAALRLTETNGSERGEGDRHGDLWDTRDMTMADPYTPEKSKALFGNSHMSTVMLEIASLQEDTFSPKLIIERTGLLGSVVHPLIHRLTDAGQIEYLGRGADGKAKIYRVRHTHIWDAMKKYADGVDDELAKRAS